MHPDADPSDNARRKFEEYTAAYGVLSDPGKRSTYDQVGHMVYVWIIDVYIYTSLLYAAGSKGTKGKKWLLSVSCLVKEKVDSK